MSVLSNLRQQWPAVLIPLLLIATAVLGLQMMAPVDHPLLHGPAPGFALPVVAGPGAREGDRIDLQSLRGRVVILDFWATWCPPCRASIPALNEVYHRNQDRKVTLVGVNVEPGLPQEQLGSAHRAFGARFPSVQDTAERELQRGYQVSQLPTLVVLGPDGSVRQVEVGVADPDRLQRTIDQILAEL